MWRGILMRNAAAPQGNCSALPEKTNVSDGCGGDRQLLKQKITRRGLRYRGHGLVHGAAL